MGTIITRIPPHTSKYDRLETVYPQLDSTFTIILSSPPPHSTQIREHAHKKCGNGPIGATGSSPPSPRQNDRQPCFPRHCNGIITKRKTIQSRMHKSPTHTSCTTLMHPLVVSTPGITVRKRDLCRLDGHSVFHILFTATNVGKPSGSSIQCFYQRTVYTTPFSTCGHSEPLG